MDDDRFRAPGAPEPAPPSAPPAWTPPGSPGSPGSVPPAGPTPGWVPPSGWVASPAVEPGRALGWTPPPTTRGRPLLVGGALALAALVVFSLGVSVGQVGGALGPGPAPTPGYSPAAGRPDWRLLDQAYDLLDQHYVDPQALDPLELERGAINGMADSLDDRGHTGYLTPEEVKARDAALSGTFVGIGVVPDRRDGRIIVVRVLRDSPAERAGLQAGDEFLAVDGVSIVGGTVDEMIRRVRGPEGSAVTVEVRSPAGVTRTLTITRAKLERPLVSWDFAPGTRDAVIRLESFSTGAAKAVAGALRDALAQGAEGVVLDLRGNPGGYVNEPIETTSQFLEDGLVYRSVDRSGKETPHQVEGDAIAPRLPLVVLVDDQTASSAEIVTGALQDAGRAPVVGVKTFGTGTVVLTYPLADGSALAIGTERWLTPGGHAIWREGLTPDEVVELPEGAALVFPDDFATLGPGGVASTGDAQLKAALAALDREEAAAARAGKLAA